ncbi:uncharacterized protein LOC135826518 [Sycon ciliatum]|uniref:uncharacterized protein LOC135826518 n=1 Tax=Sycon ciliatum TaxID=27933 RepID=UPI0031F6C7B2
MNLVWWKGNHKLTQGTGPHLSLVLQGVEADVGLYTCTASNKAGSDSMTVGITMEVQENGNTESSGSNLSNSMLWAIVAIALVAFLTIAAIYGFVLPRVKKDGEFPEKAEKVTRASRPSSLEIRHRPPSFSRRPGISSFRPLESSQLGLIDEDPGQVCRGHRAQYRAPLSVSTTTLIETPSPSQRPTLAKKVSFPDLPELESP